MNMHSDMVPVFAATENNFLDLRVSLCVPCAGMCTDGSWRSLL